MSLSPTIIHAGFETIIIGCLAYTFHKRTSVLEAKVEMLEKKMEMYEKILANHNQILGIVTQRAPPPEQPEPSPSPRPPPRRDPQKPPIAPPQNRSRPPAPPSPDELDNLLKKELDVSGDNIEEITIGDVEDPQ